MMDRVVSAVWHEDERVLAARLSGVLGLEDVEAWRAELDRAAMLAGPGGAFKALIDIRGYEVSEQEMAVHRVQREVVPLFLASHGFRMGFFDLYEEEPPVGRDASRALCVAVAHVHHDRDKMDRYNELLARSVERFFCSPEEAEAWLREAPSAVAEPVG